MFKKGLQKKKQDFQALGEGTDQITPSLKDLASDRDKLSKLQKKLSITKKSVKDGPSGEEGGRGQATWVHCPIKWDSGPNMGIFFNELSL